MSAINTVIDKLRKILEDSPNTGQMEEGMRECISLLTDPTVLLLEWNGEDVQQVAREKIAGMDDVMEEQIKMNPLSKDDVEWVISRLDKYYDCNYGISWDSISDALDEVTLPDAELAMKRTADELLLEGFKCTDEDTNQWVKKAEDDRCYLVYEKERMFYIDLTKYTDEQLDNYIAAYYPSLKEMREMYGDDADWIIAECIAETDCY